MVAIKDMEMPGCCAKCDFKEDYCFYCNRLQKRIPQSNFFDSRLPDCPLLEIEERKVGKWIPVVNVDNSPFDNVKERKVEKCTDCNEYNQEKHYCPKFCDVIRDTTKEMQEFYKGEHEKLERIEQIVKDHDNDSMPEDYWYIDKIRDILKE